MQCDVGESGLPVALYQRVEQGQSAVDRVRVADRDVER